MIFNFYKLWNFWDLDSVNIPSSVMFPQPIKSKAVRFSKLSCLQNCSRSWL